MYYPYFRGKQFDLITIRETAALMARCGFVPIIEPVKDVLGGLERALKSLVDAGAKSIVVINPFHGDHADDGTQIEEFLIKNFSKDRLVSAGINLDADMSVQQAMDLYADHVTLDPVFIHAGFSDGKGLAEALGASLDGSTHVFIDNQSVKAYRRHFKSAQRVLVKDGFNRLQRNADYPPLEIFSDLHVSFDEEGMDGFGDFLTVGNDFREGGGPAYAVAIHLTYIDSNKDDVMYIRHFVSVDKDTPTDPAGKFKQALDLLVDEVNAEGSKIIRGEAVREFLDLHSKGHFPGLGQVKKLSMKHHIETLAAYLVKG